MFFHSCANVPPGQTPPLHSPTPPLSDECNQTIIQCWHSTVELGLPTRDYCLTDAAMLRAAHGLINDLPAGGHRWGLLFSPLCGWEKTTEISTDIHQITSSTRCAVTVKISAPTNDNTPERLVSELRNHIGHPWECLGRGWISIVCGQGPWTKTCFHSQLYLHETLYVMFFQRAMNCKKLALHRCVTSDS